MTTHGATAHAPLITAAVAAGSVLCAATAFAGVLSDASWVVPAVLTVLTVSGIGVLTRHLRWPTGVVVLTQVVALLLLVTALFADQAVFGAVPLPATFGEFATLLGQAGETVRSGVPPVPVDPALQFLLCAVLGLVTLAVDIIAVTAGTPAAAGLVLLCVFAVPASLSSDLLPWWSFVLAVLGFAVLLTVGGRQQHTQRSTPPARPDRGLLGPSGVAIVATAGVLGLLSGVVFTGVGTHGRLPGSGPNGTAGAEGVGLRPFTSLQGQLNRGEATELFRVSGLPEGTYLRAMTLRQFDANKGWSLDGLTQGVDAGPDLPLPEGTTIAQGDTAKVHVKPVNYRDPWLPVFGTPLSVSGMGPGWRYDPAAGIVFTQQKQDSREYEQRMLLQKPTAEQLRDAEGPAPISPAYSDKRGIPPRVGNLAQRVAADEPTDFDKAVALNRFFTNPSNGFNYDVSTGSDTGSDALSKFMFDNRRGYCEQYASSMAAMLREIGIPSRVAVGFTPGTKQGGERVITTNDAHAWVEAYFPGWGWQTFDPTPLDDGRTSLPQYLDDAGEQPSPEPPAGSAEGSEQPPRQPDTDEPSASRPESPSTVPSWPFVTVALAIVFGLTTIPIGLRELRRRRRLSTATTGGPTAAAHAWREACDEFNDRATPVLPTETVRTAASRLSATHGLDQPGSNALWNLALAVEHAWYAPAGSDDATGSPEDAWSPADALRVVRTSLHQHTPLTWSQRVFPRSVVHRTHR